MLDFTRGLLYIIILTGIGQAIGKFYNDAESPEKRRVVMSTTLWFSVVSAIFWVLITLSIDDKISLFLLGSEDLKGYVDLFVIALLFEILMMISLRYYQVEKLSVVFVSINIIRLILNILLNLIFIIVFGMGAKGMLYGNLISVSIVGSYVTVFCFYKNGIRWAPDLFRGMIKFGIPLVPAMLCATLMHGADRYILRHFLTLEIVAIYSLGYKFPFMLNTLITESFQRIWGLSTMFTISREDNAEELYGRIATYFLSICIFAQFSLGLMAPTVMKIMVASSYYKAYHVVPVVALAISFYCLHNFFVIGAYIKKRTSLLPISYGVSCILNVGLNWYLVPIYGHMASAWISVVTYLMFSAVAFLIYRRIYPINFEYKRLCLLFIYAIGLGVINYQIVFENFVLEFAKEITFILTFLVLILFGPFLREDERLMIVKLMNKASARVRELFPGKIIS